MPTVFTIGHATRTIDEFLVLLQQVSIDHLIDVRAILRSRTSPQFDSGSLRKALAVVRIEYCHIAALDGLPMRRVRNAGASSGFGCDASLRHYAAYAETAAFQLGMIELRDLALDYCCAIMGEEALWWRCHRRIVADYLLANGIMVAHIMGLGEIDIATLTPGVQPLPGGRLRYFTAGVSSDTEDLI
jgi:uncharacterized protein (DUF488 family)